jgi:hypothetical protein
MVSSNSRGGSKASTLNAIASPKGLAARFFELQRLRKQVHELERQAGIESRRNDARSEDMRRRK